MASYNRVVLVGNLTRDPEVRYTQSATAVCEIGLAMNRKWFNKEKQQQEEETTFVDVTLWGKPAEIAGQYLVKGSSVLIEGRLQLDQWKDQATGDNRSKLKVVGETMQMLGSRPSGQQQAQQQPPQDQMPPSPVDSFYDSVPDDEVPF